MTEKQASKLHAVVCDAFSVDSDGVDIKRNDDAPVGMGYFISIPPSGHTRYNRVALSDESEWKAWLEGNPSLQAMLKFRDAVRKYLQTVITPDNRYFYSVTSMVQDEGQKLVKRYMVPCDGGFIDHESETSRPERWHTDHECETCQSARNNLKYRLDGNRCARCGKYQFDSSAPDSPRLCVDCEEKGESIPDAVLDAQTAVSCDPEAIRTGTLAYEFYRYRRLLEEEREKKETANR